MPTDTTAMATEMHELQPTRQPTPNATTSQTLNQATSNADPGRIFHSELTRRPITSASTLRIFLTVFQLCMINFVSSFTNGIITVGLPTIASSISLPRTLYLWPSSVYGLTSGATLLLAGSIADFIGPRRVEVLGCILLSISILASGFANTGIQIVVFRAVQGIAMSMHLPASVALVAAAVPRGRSRNIAFGCLGLSQPLGFSAGLVISGIIIEKAGWRFGFYFAGAAAFVATGAGIWSLPKLSTEHLVSEGNETASMLRRLWAGIDWIGGIIAATGLSLLAYVLALLSADLSIVHKASTASLLALSLGILLAFPLWMRQRERSGKPALIPNSLWNLPFTSTCIMVSLSYAVINSMELFSSLYFQEIQNTSTLFTSLRLLPSLLVGVIINLTVGIFIDKVSALYLVTISSMLCAIAPLLMALVNPEWNYWYIEFWAQGLSPVSADVLFTVGLLIVSDEFPEETQALAGAVFNTAAQFGMSLGMGACQVVALAVSSRGKSQSHSETDTSRNPKEGIEQLLKGYQASFWTMFAFMVTCGIIGIGGLRKIGKVGVKRD